MRLENYNIEKYTLKNKSTFSKKKYIHLIFLKCHNAMF